MPSLEAPLLLVDDCVENLLAFEAILAPLGQPILRASSGEEALRVLLQREVAAILLDVQMPVLDGLETARLIRERPTTAHVPILFITALSRETHHVMRGYAAGAVDYLLKPIDPDVLRSKVRCFVDLHLKSMELRLRERELTERRLAEEEARRQAAFAERLVGIVAHDLRTPLSAIRASAQLAARRPCDDPEHHKAFHRIDRVSNRMRGIANVLMDFTRVSIGQRLRFRHEPCELIGAVDEVISEALSAHPEARIARVDSPARLEGCLDRGRLQQAVANLVENAVRHATEDGVRLRVYEDGEYACLEVHNGGQPIPLELRETLFEPFRRPEAELSSVNGLGLGLYIVREIARGHGGGVEVRSSEETGTAFVLKVLRYNAPCDLPSEAAEAVH